MKTKMLPTLGLILFLSIAPCMPSYGNHAVPVSASTAPSESPRGLVWHIEMVDKKGGFCSALALDDNGFPHIAYQAENPSSPFPHALNLARWTGAKWVMDVVDTQGDTGWVVASLALDHAGNPHIGYGGHQYPGISYYDHIHGELKYARWIGSEWDVQVVDGNGNVGRPNSLALDTKGHPHIGYYAFTFDTLKHAHWTGASWEIEDVDSIGGAIHRLEIALVLDAGDRPHIAYVDGMTNTVKYAHLAGNARLIETVDTGAYSVSIGLDDAGNPHISCTNSGFELKYAVGSPRLPIYFPLIGCKG